MWSSGTYGTDGDDAEDEIPDERVETNGEGTESEDDAGAVDSLRSTRAVLKGAASARVAAPVEHGAAPKRAGGIASAIMQPWLSSLDSVAATSVHPLHAKFIQKDAAELAAADAQVAALIFGVQRETGDAAVEGPIAIRASASPPPTLAQGASADDSEGSRADAGSYSAAELDALDYVHSLHLHSSLIRSVSSGSGSQ
jgi:hypothetical protein